MASQTTTDSGYTSTDPAVQARIAEMQRQAEASAAAQRAAATATTTTAAPAATTTTTTPTSTPTTSTSSYTSTPTSYSTETTARPVLNEYKNYDLSLPEMPPTLAELRAQELEQAQKVIDASQFAYEEERNRRAEAARRNQAMARAMNVGAGLSGSPMLATPGASVSGIQRESDYELNRLSRDRAADIERMIGESSKNAEARYQQGLNDYYQRRQMYISERDKAIAEQEARIKAEKESALNSLTTIAKSGYSIDEMDREQYKDLLAKSGMSDFEARATWAAASPKANAQYSVQNGYLVGTYFDPHTGKPVVTTTALPQELTESDYTPDVKSVTLADGSVIFYDGNNPYGADGRLQTIDYAGSSIAKQVGGLSDPQKASIFNSIVGKYNASPLIMAADRLPVLEAAVQAIQENPEDAALQLNLSYAYIQALDTYQSAVREGELANLNSIDSKVGGLQNYLSQIQNGQIVRPEVAQQIAEAAQGIINTIQSSAAQKAQSFASQANVAGVGEEWSQYLSGFTPNYGTSSSGDYQPAPDDSGITFNQSFATPDAIAQAYPELQDDISKLLDAGYNDAEITQYFNGKYGAGGQSFNNDLSMSQKGPEYVERSVAMQKVVDKYPEGSHGGQCGRFVNKNTGLKMGDSFESKMALTDRNIGTPENPPMPGDVFVMPYSWTGHTGLVERVDRMPDGTYRITAIDSNFGLDEKVRRHYISSKVVSGYARPSKIVA